MSDPQEKNKGRGTEEEFKSILQQLNNNTQTWLSSTELGRFMKYSSYIDTIFGSYTWSRIEFFKELDRRVQTLKSRGQ